MHKHTHTCMCTHSGKHTHTYRTFIIAGIKNRCVSTIYDWKVYRLPLPYDSLTYTFWLMMVAKICQYHHSFTFNSQWTTWDSQHLILREPTGWCCGTVGTATPCTACIISEYWFMSRLLHFWYQSPSNGLKINSVNSSTWVPLTHMEDLQEAPDSILAWLSQ